MRQPIEQEESFPEENKVNGLSMDVLKETIQAVQNDPELGKCKFRASNKWVDGNHNCTGIEGFYAAKQEIEHKQKFELHADEPPILAGADSAANPVEHLLHALASCVTTSMVAHAAAQGIEIHELECELEGDLDMNGYLGLNKNVPKGYTDIRMKFKVKSDEKDLDKLKNLAMFSPVFNSLMNGVNVDIQVESK